MKTKKSILIVEDDKILAKYISNILISHNFNTDLAFDGNEAFSKINNNRFEVILTDWLMPKMDGLSLIKKIRKEIQKPPIIIVVTTMNFKKHSY